MTESDNAGVKDDKSNNGYNEKLWSYNEKL